MTDASSVLSSLVQNLSCPVHPDAKEEKDFYLYEGKKARCKACVAEKRRDNYLKHKAEPTTPKSSKPAPEPKSAKDEPADPADAWGPYKGMTKEEIRIRKRNRGLTGMAWGTTVWLSPEEWKAQEKWLEEYKANLAKKHGGHNE